ncbi:F-box protein [Vitis vinifera]|uniref:F-box protein n=1 Tax=Vitis vinifera TaxID=29760 RepID=A0A438CHL7_VITVI|nr:F-box protein [Vitis vinifera]
MDRGKRPSKSIVGGNNKIYMDLKDIIREYTLPFLPAKSLFRFTGVCRDWKMQISTPFFAHNQSNSFHAVSGLFYQIAGEPPSFISLDPKAYGVPDPSLKFLPVPVDIRASCNGLLCCQARTGDKAYYMCNPATKMWKKLPKPDADHGTDPALVVIFEPSLLNFVADYKLETPAKPGVHVNGIVYWQMKHGVLVAFDLARERSQLIYGMKGALCVMQGKLCSVSMHGWTVTVNVLSNVYSNTMEMHSKARTWVQKRLINLDPSALGAGSCKQPSVVFC